MQKDTPRASALTSYVSALPMDRPKIIEVAPREFPLRELPLAPIVEPMPYSGHVDRAKGFSIATAPLAVVTGIVAAIVGIIGWSVPIASLITLLLALGGFALVWLIAYAAHVFVSSDGALVIHTLLMWRLLFVEAKERRARYHGK